MSQNDDSVFHKPSEPKNSLQLLSWLIFEPTLLHRFSETLTRKQAGMQYLRAVPWLILISFSVYSLACFILAASDAPLLFSSQFRSRFVYNYWIVDGFPQHLLFTLQAEFLIFIISLIFSSTLGLALSLARGRAVGLAKGLALGLILGLSLGLGVSQTIGWAFGLIVALATGLAGGMVGERNGRLAGGLSVGLVVGLATGLAAGVGIGLAGGLSYCLVFFRLYVYPLYWLRSLWRLDFYHSPYFQDELIFLPLWGAADQFRLLAVESPTEAAKFITFLREYRPLQSKLADQISHAALAGSWRHQPLTFECLTPPIIENKVFQPSEDWVNQLAQFKQQLIAYRQQIQPSLKQQQFQLFQQQLGAFYQQTLVENRDWRNEYLEALRLWQQVAEEEAQNLSAKMQQLEPITRNVYLSGEALRPHDNSQVFLGRDDLKDELTRRICSAQQMPLFLIQGQRRVGKTSLLNFLEPLLGSGFKVVYQDLQSARIGTTVQSWLSDLQTEIHRKLGLPAPAEISSTDWLSAWRQFETGLQTLSLDGCKLILALDEYEELNKELLSTDPKQGGRLLAAMRSFSQHQNQIVFLFVGAAFLDELTNPSWATYFVQAQTFRVDYLPHDAALRLITEPVRLIYPPDLPEQMVVLTDGHPALLQRMCSEMVNIANRTPRKNMTQADLDAVVQIVVEDSSIQPMRRFWDNFCKDAACKATVREIVQQQPISDKKQLHRLREHGFIVQNPAGQWQLRVPLFEQWLLRFDRLALD